MVVRKDFYFYIFSSTSTFQLLDEPWSRVSSLLPPGSCLHFFIAHRVRQSHCASIFHRVLLTHALALSASQFVRKKKSPRIYTSMLLGGFQLTKLIFFFFFRTLLLPSFWTSRVHRFRPFYPSGSCLHFFIAHRVRQSHCSSIFHRVLLTHALALPASQFVRKKKSPRIYTSMHSGEFELTKLTNTRLEDNLIRHRGDRLDLYQARG